MDVGQNIECAKNKSATAQQKSNQTCDTLHNVVINSDVVIKFRYALLCRVYVGIKSVRFLQHEKKRSAHLDWKHCPARVTPKTLKKNKKKRKTVQAHTHLPIVLTSSTAAH